MLTIEGKKEYLLNEIKRIIKTSESYYFSLMWEYNNLDWSDSHAVRMFEFYLVRVRMYINQEY